MLINAVAPFAGAWIEIGELYADEEVGIVVAPFAGAWIEIFFGNIPAGDGSESLPSRERGLK